MACGILLIAVVAVAGVLVRHAGLGTATPALVIGVPSGEPTPAAVQTGSTATPANMAKPSPAGTLPETRQDIDVPEAELLEPGPYGPLPRIAPDGRTPRDVYAHPFDGRDDRSRIVVIITNLGLDEVRTAAVIRRLPEAVTLAFSPYGGNLATLAEAAREDGHELLITLPLEAEAFPYRDPGPRALLAVLPQDQNLDRLAWNLGRFAGYVGAANFSGDRFRADDSGMRMLLSELGRRGLLFVDGIVDTPALDVRDGDAGAVPIVYVDVDIDAVPSRTAIDSALATLERIAAERAIAVGVAHPFPVTIDRLAAWMETLNERNLVLAPATSVAGRQVRP